VNFRVVSEEYIILYELMIVMVGFYIAFASP
jgi:hypothetical protein